MKNLLHSTIYLPVVLALHLVSSCEKTEDATPVTGNSVMERPSPALADLIGVPAGNAQFFHAYAVGYQVYVITKTPAGYWLVYQGPEAILYASENSYDIVGKLSSGPLWQSNSGSSVTGTTLRSMNAPVANAIPWLLIKATTTSGSGIFDAVTYIQQVHTIGGKAPVYREDTGTIGSVIRIPFKADYYFYRADTPL